MSQEMVCYCKCTVYIESFNYDYVYAETMSWTSACHMPGLAGILPPLIIKVVKMHNNMLLHTAIYSGRYGDHRHNVKYSDIFPTLLLTVHYLSSKTMSWASACHMTGLAGILPPLIIEIVKIFKSFLPHIAIYSGRYCDNPNNVKYSEIYPTLLLTVYYFSAMTMSWTSVCHVPGLAGILPPLIIKIHNNQILSSTQCYLFRKVLSPPS